MIPRRTALLLAAGACTLAAQAPKQLLDALAPRQPAVTIEYTNPFDQSHSEALVDLPPDLKTPVPLIVSPHAANWTQEMNRPLWSGVAERFGVIVLYPRHQGKVSPRLSLGADNQLANLEAAIAETERRYPVDKSRVYIAGLSQGAVETLLMAGHHPKQFAGAMSINPISDFRAFFNDVGPEDVGRTPDAGLRKLREVQWPALRKLVEVDLGGTPDAAKPAYDHRSPASYARELATVPLILYWAENDELIPNGATHQGGRLAEEIRKFHPVALHEVKHKGGHGYPFYRVDLNQMSVEIFPRDIFLESVRELLGKSPKPRTREAN